MRLLTTFILLTKCLSVVAQTTPERNWVDTEVKYTNSTGQIIRVYNSYPKGGGEYLNSGGNDYSYVIFWTRVVNESTSQLKLSVKFPADSFLIFPSKSSYLKLLIPPDTMTIQKISLGDYGLTNLKFILDNGFNKPSLFERTLNPNEECLFYIPIFIHQARGTARAALVLKGEDLFYRISINPESALIPCGRIEFKN